jgi:hypothetical protein
MVRQDLRPLLRDFYPRLSNLFPKLICMSLCKVVSALSQILKNCYVIILNIQKLSSACEFPARLSPCLIVRLPEEYIRVVPTVLYSVQSGPDHSVERGARSFADGDHH